MSYPSPADVNMSAGMPSVISYLNEVTLGWFFNMLLIAIYVIILMGFVKTTQNWIGGFAVAGFTTFTIALLLFLGSAIHGVTLGIVVAFMLIGVFVLFLGKN